MRNTKKKLKPEPSEADLAQARELRDVLEEVSEMPYADQWELALEILPDAFFHYFVAASKRGSEEERMNYYGPMVIVLANYYLPDEEVTGQAMMVALVGMTYSVYGELERRQKHFCTNVVFPDDPIYYDPEEPVMFIPKEPETFRIEALMEYYSQSVTGGGSGD